VVVVVVVVVFVAYMALSVHRWEIVAAEAAWRYELYVCNLTP